MGVELESLDCNPASPFPSGETVDRCLKLPMLQFP